MNSRKSAISTLFSGHDDLENQSYIMFCPTIIISTKYEADMAMRSLVIAFLPLMIRNLVTLAFLLWSVTTRWVTRSTSFRSLKILRLSVLGLLVTTFLYRKTLIMRFQPLLMHRIK